MGLCLSPIPQGISPLYQNALKRCLLISTFSIAIYSIIFKENSLKTQIGLFQKEQSDRHSHEISPSDIRNNYEDFYIADSVCADSVVLDYIPIISKSNEQIKQIQNQDLLKELEKRILIIENGISDNPEKTLSNKNLEQQIINLQVQVNNLKEIINISTNSLSNSVNWAFGLIISLYAGVLIAIISWVLTQNIKWTKRKDD